MKSTNSQPGTNGSTPRDRVGHVAARGQQHAHHRQERGRSRRWLRNTVQKIDAARGPAGQVADPVGRVEQVGDRARRRSPRRRRGCAASVSHVVSSPRPRRRPLARRRSRYASTSDEHERQRDGEDALQRRPSSRGRRSRSTADAPSTTSVASDLPGVARLAPSRGRPCSASSGEHAEDAVDRLERDRGQPRQHGVRQVAARAEHRARERHRRQPGADAADRGERDGREQQRAEHDGDQRLPTLSPSSSAITPTDDEEQVRVRADPEVGRLAQRHRALGLRDVVEARAARARRRVARPPSAQMTVPPFGERTWPTK